MVRQYAGDRTTGFASPAADSIEGPIDLFDILSLRKPSRYPVRVQGLSFVSRGVFDRDILIADTAGVPVSGSLVIACAKGEVILAELKYRNDKWFLVSGNDAQQPLRVDPLRDVEIWGNITGLVRTEV
ncbi:MAG: S24 family peptidase [Acetobacter sp.]|jgi:DNA polymerase V|nr:S24 family peptidase [Acetobacter sp.]MCI1485809.1 S24 family peptidase [Acetobacter sp.]MCI1529809.1 S24 family peptidase [Acetobacter sp.]MCI1587522.1 S24 family peptidase [Acetobacter sp.]MCI1601739.1 S24 family peptidase [Acetobacter sp.]